MTYRLLEAFEREFDASIAGYDSGVEQVTSIMSVIRIFCLSAIGLAVLAGPAFAGIGPAPGPVAGIGLPALALIGGTYWASRKLFARKK